MTQKKNGKQFAHSSANKERKKKRHATGPY